MPSTADPIVRLRSLARGSLPAWPELVDGVSEWWFELAPRLRMMAVATVATAVLLTAAQLGSRSPWGPEVPVLVASRALPAGHTLAPGDLVPAVRPARAVPSGAAAVDDPWVGAVLVGALPADSVVHGSHLARDGIASLVQPGRVAVAVPAELLPPLDAGQRVDLIGGDSQVGGQHVAPGGRVLGVDGEHVWIEVGRADAAAVSAAIAWGRLTVALLRG